MIWAGTCQTGRPLLFFPGWTFTANSLFTPEFWRLAPAPAPAPTPPPSPRSFQIPEETVLVSSSSPGGGLSLGQAGSLDSFPRTPGVVTQNYLRWILNLGQETKAWECFQSRRGEHPDTYSFLVHVTQQRELKDVTPAPNRPFWARDRSLENVLQLVSHT